jgi:hypothetical protein
MPLVRRIRKRGANVVVEAHGEVLFSATGDVGRWTNRFSQRVRTFAAQEAPVNKRPRWAHYGKPLKQTLTASTTYQPVRMRVYSAVGSSAPHAYYVDQGTGVFAGNGPYKAKVLPPWTRGGPSLYEHTWRPAGPGGKRVEPVYIKGQKGQGFFDAGLRRAFRSMRMRSFQTPGDARITEALSSVPTGLTNFFGNTPADDAFVAQLNEWREWRDAAWNRGDSLGRNPTRRPAKPTKPKKVKAVKPPKPKPAKPTKPTKPKGYESVAEKKAAAVKQFQKQNPNVKIIRVVTSAGIIVKTPQGPYLISWSQLYNLLPR